MNKRNHYHKIVGNETSIEIGKSKKTLNITNRSWGSLVDNGLNLAKIHVNAIFRDDVAKEFHFGLMKFTFFQLDIKFDFPKLIQNKLNMLFMFL
jgi:hypothetical protein